MTSAGTISAERRWLERMRERWHHRRFVHPDPLLYLYRYPRLADREIAGLVASSLAYGNVKAMLPAIATVLDALGPSPADALARRSPAALVRTFGAFRYRMTSGAQLAGLLVAARAVIREQGTLERALTSDGGPTGAETSLDAVASLVDALEAAAPCPLDHLVPHPRRGSACKRLNLYLRWMVRCDDIDPGGWTAIAPAQLVVPLDTHVFQLAHRRGWTTRRSANLRTALDITRALRVHAPQDPLRYDFSVTRPGIRREGDSEATGRQSEPRRDAGPPGIMTQGSTCARR